MNRQKSTKFCIHIIIDTIYVWIVYCHFSQICNRETALDSHKKNQLFLMSWEQIDLLRPLFVYCYVHPLYIHIPPWHLFCFLPWLDTLIVWCIYIYIYWWSSFDHKIGLKLPLVRPISDYPFHPIRSQAWTNQWLPFFIQSADRRDNYQPIRYLFNGITLEMNLSIYKALKGVHWGQDTARIPFLKP